MGDDELLNQLKKESEKKDADIESLSLKITEFISQINDHKSQITDYKSQINDNKSEINDFKSQINDFKNLKESANKNKSDV